MKKKIYQFQAKKEHPYEFKRLDGKGAKLAILFIVRTLNSIERRLLIYSSRCPSSATLKTVATVHAMVYITANPSVAVLTRKI